MENTLHYDFSLSRAACVSMDETAELLNRDVVLTREKNLELLGRAWQSEEARLYSQKYNKFVDDVKRLAEEINVQSERVRRISALMYAKEQAAKKIASEKGN